MLDKFDVVSEWVRDGQTDLWRSFASKNNYRMRCHKGEGVDKYQNDKLQLVNKGCNNFHNFLSKLMNSAHSKLFSQTADFLFWLGADK